MFRATVLLALICTLTLHAAYPDSIEVDVTFFDFHSDGSSPDFNPGADTESITEGLVEEKLSAEGIPVSTGKHLYCYDISRWFRPNKKGAYKTIPHYGWGGWLDWVDTLNSSEQSQDTSYINMVIDTHLVFEHKGNGIYSFESSSFFPLDNKGFGNETTINWNGSIATSHNYSFTMKLERDFVYQKGLTFDFKGDDDVWVFIDGRLALDIGGCHPEESGSFQLDKLADSFKLKEGNTYKLSFFFAERQADGSNCKITSNIISAPPTQMTIKVSPSDTVIAGDTLNLEVLIDSDTGLVDNIEGEVEWSFIDAYQVNNQSAISSIAPKEAILSPIKAHTTLQVIASYYEKSSGLFFVDTAEVVVIPNKPEILTIEQSGSHPDDGTDRLWEIFSIDTITIRESDKYTENFFAVFRDRYLNWVSPYSTASNSDWNTLDTLLATAQKGGEDSKGEGKALRNKSILGGETKLYVNALDTLSDTTVLILEKMYRVECQPLPTPFSPDSLLTLPGVEDKTGLAFTFPFIGSCGEFAFAESIAITIYDNIGNTIHTITADTDDITMTYNVDGTFNGQKVDAMAIVTWNGRNRNDRKVSTGTYIAIVSFTDNSGTHFQHTTPISITE